MSRIKRQTQIHKHTYTQRFIYFICYVHTHIYLCIYLKDRHVKIKGALNGMGKINELVWNVANLPFKMQQAYFSTSVEAFHTEESLCSVLGCMVTDMPVELNASDGILEPMDTQEEWGCLYCFGSRLHLLFPTAFVLLASSPITNCPLIPILLLPPFLSLINEIIYGMHLALHLAPCEYSVNISYYHYCTLILSTSPWCFFRANNLILILLKERWDWWRQGGYPTSVRSQDSWTAL